LIPRISSDRLELTTCNSAVCSTCKNEAGGVTEIATTFAGPNPTYVDVKVIKRKLFKNYNEGKESSESAQRPGNRSMGAPGCPRS
jgi:hypothetical protein